VKFKVVFKIDYKKLECTYVYMDLYARFRVTELSPLVVKV